MAVLLALAVARVIRLVVVDQITAPARRWVMSHFGEEGWQAYLVHCVWCSGIWVAVPLTVITLTWPDNRFWLGFLLFLAVSHVGALIADR